MTFLAILFPLAASALCASLFGLLSWWLWLIFLFPLALGVTVGWSIVFSRLAFKKNVGNSLFVTALIFGGMALEEVHEDHHQRRAFAEALYESRLADSGLPMEEILKLREESDGRFLTQDADELLEAQIHEHFGIGGYLGRWLGRLQAGIRLAGHWRQGYGLPLGLTGSLVYLVLAFLLAKRLAKRIIGFRTPPSSLHHSHAKGGSGN